MNTKEITTEMKKRLQIDANTTEALFESFTDCLKEELLNGNTISIAGFGMFEAKRNKERISINPTTKQRLLSPPKQTVAFKVSSTLKDKFNQ